MIERLREEYNLDIVSPFKITIENVDYNFNCLIKGYGAQNGMIIDNDYNKISSIQEQLIKLGYGFSCFNITEVAGDFNEVLNDWGKSV